MPDQVVWVVTNQHSWDAHEGGDQLTVRSSLASAFAIIADRLADYPCESESQRSIWQTELEWHREDPTEEIERYVGPYCIRAEKVED